MAIDQKLELSGTTPEQIYSTLIQKNVSASDAAILVGGWIYHNFGRAQRTFNYAEAFPAEEQACKPVFNRGFHHSDWTDGESVVQAGVTVGGEQGFNKRFHDIEGDLDALSQDIAKLFSCLAEMRKDLSAMLNEVRTELNRLNADVFQLSGKTFGVISDPSGKLAPFGQLVQSADFLGFTKFAQKDVSLWRTPSGVMMLPGMSTLGVDLMSDPRMNRVAGLGAFVNLNSKRITDTLGNQPFTKQLFVQKFGNETTPDGQSIRDLVGILPDVASFKTPQEMIDAVSEGEAAALRTSGGVPAAVALSLGLEIAPKDVGTATLDRFSAIPQDARTVLISKGIDNISKLAAAKPDEIAKTLADAGIQSVKAGDAGAWTTIAKTLTRI
ncbi:MAG TPA: hypothetical protein VFN26_06060 [Candidatus Acidoferrum sp.]|nr:hypothetical protein [Candidatus Acidoferrum sp.]